MAPMIDMVFLLLVFFMTVSSLAREDLRPIALPESEESKIPEEILDRGTITLTWKDEAVREEPVIFVGPQQVEASALESLIASTLKGNPELQINLRADHDMPFRRIQDVLRICAQAGAFHIVYATYQL